MMSNDRERRVMLEMLNHKEFNFISCQEPFMVVDVSAIGLDHPKHYLGDPPELIVQDLPKLSEYIALPTEKQTPKGSRQRKGDKPIQHGPANRKRW